jgi:hypothetical protein
LINAVVFNFRKNQLFPQAQGVVASTVKTFGADAAKVTNAGKDRLMRRFKKAYMRSERRVTITPTGIPDEF